MVLHTHFRPIFILSRTCSLRESKPSMKEEPLCYPFPYLCTKCPSCKWATESCDLSEPCSIKPCCVLFLTSSLLDLWLYKSTHKLFLDGPRHSRHPRIRCSCATMFCISFHLSPTFHDFFYSLKDQVVSLSKGDGGTTCTPLSRLDSVPSLFG